MEGHKPDFEQREREIDTLITRLAEHEGMEPDDILSDIMTFAPFEENEEFSNPEYFEILAEQLGISLEEMNEFALKKVKDQQNETE